MTRTEQATIKALAQSMLDSTSTSWKTGDVTDFKNWASIMRSKIQISAQVMFELCKLDPEENEDKDTNPIKLD